MAREERGQRLDPATTALSLARVGRWAAALLGIKGLAILAIALAVLAALFGGLTMFAVTVMQTQAYFGRQGLAIPPDQLAVMLEVEGQYGIPWQVLAAIARVESSFGRNMGPSPAGAIGYCQFMPETWASYGRDEDGDGSADPMSYRDCLPAVARYLLDHGWRGDDREAQRQALFAYNHDWTYVDQILLVAAVYGLGGLWEGGLRWPLPGYYAISSFFGQVDEARGPSPHTGIDIPAPEGTPALAAGDGLVESVTLDSVCGLGVVIAHRQNVRTVYCHLSQATVTPGQVVRTGDRIGAVGNTGLSTGPHLHLGLIIDGVAVDPLRYLEV